VLRVAAIACVLAACAPVVDGPADRARATDLADSDRLAATLATLPTVISARATVRRAFRDPLNGTTSPASASVLVVVDGDAEATRVQATALVHATAPEIASPVVVVVPGAPRPVLASVGPFVVERRSRTPLVAALAAGLAVIAALAIALARKSR
jgi:type III secretory pathway lipoprotein EscJ